jgi:hypothetical protein
VNHAHQPTERLSLREVGGGLVLGLLILVGLVFFLAAGPVPA